MAPVTVGQTIVLAASARGGTPAGREDDLVTEVRARLSDMSHKDSELALRTVFIYGCVPIVEYLRRSHSDTAGLNTSASTCSRS